MENTQTITFRLESYLLQLSDICRRWQKWLAGGELAAVSQNREQLSQLEPQAAQLFAELNQAVRDREAILVHARQTGLPHADLDSLARSLPAWRKTKLRLAMLSAKEQLSQLRRLHVSTWVLLHHSTQFYGGTLRLMMSGSQPPTYLDSAETDTSGGRLLDASL